MNHSGSFLLGERDGLCVIDCAICGFAHLDNIPNPDALTTYYASDFWQNDKPGALERMNEQAEWWTAIHGDWLSLLARATLGRSLLDVGCGFGHFLDAAKRDGWKCTGLEPSAAAHAVARNKGHLVIMDGWEALTVGKHDAIVALWLIEHLPDPLAFLRWCAERLYGGGALLIVAPHDFSDIQMRANGVVARPFWFVHKTHLNYFNPMSLAGLLGRAGFRVIVHLTAYPMERFLCAKSDYTINDELGRQCHARVEQFDLRMTSEQRIALYQRWARRGVGREIVFVAVKEGW